MDFLSVAIQRKKKKEAVGRLVLRFYGDSLWRWEHQERLRVAAEREAFRRRAAEAYSAALLRQLRRRREQEHERWLWWLQIFQLQVWAEEEWVNRWQ